MKRVLITGKDSYIGINVKKRLLKEKSKYIVDELDMKCTSWREYDFSNYDIIFHVAGIAHISTKRKLQSLYFEVNRDLAIETAKKAKKSGVSHFIFMSSIIIFGKDNGINDYRPIDKNVYNPINAYGQSKLEADLAISNLQTSSFNTSIIRTPMVYGPNCKGNFPKLQKIARIIPIFPNIENKRSMIYIDNLAEYLYFVIEKGAYGVKYPQNNEYLSTKKIVEISRKQYGKKYVETKIFNPLIKFLAIFISKINKIYGNKFYRIEEKDDLLVSSNVVSVENSIILSLDKDTIGDKYNENNSE